MSNRCRDSIHKYRRYQKSTKTKNPDVYYCIRCPHYVRVSYVIGHKCECWLCGKTFIMNDNTLTLKPNCGCAKEMKVKNNPSTQAILDELMLKIQGVKV